MTHADSTPRNRPPASWTLACLLAATAVGLGFWLLDMVLDRTLAGLGGDPAVLSPMQHALLMLGVFLAGSCLAGWALSGRFWRIRRAEQEAGQTRRLLENIIEFLPDATFVLDAKGRVVAWNRALEKMTGMRKEEMLGRGDMDYALAFFETRRMTLADMVLQARYPAEDTGHLTSLQVKGDTLIAEILNPRLNQGQGAHAWAMAAPLYSPDGQLAGAVECIRDVTERKLDEERLRRELIMNQSLAELSAAIISGSQDLAQVSALVLEQALAITGAEHGYVAEVDPGHGNFVAHTLTAMVEHQCQVGQAQRRVVFPRNPEGRFDALWGEALNTGQGFFTNDPVRHPAWGGKLPPGHVPLRNFLCAPALMAGRTLGAVAVANAPRPFGPEDLAAVSRMADLYALAVQRLRDAQSLRASLAEKDVLLQEVHHRVKNNLQVVSSLLHLQSQRVSDPATLAALRESRDRIRSMGLVHEEIYRSKEFASAPMRGYLGRLAANLLAGSGLAGRVKLEVRVEDLSLPVDTAIPLGLFFNELLTNAFKHAFPGNRSGRVLVELRRDGPGCLARVADDGVGFPPGLDHRATESLGLQLVFSLAEQLRGELELARDQGAAFTLRFPNAA